MLRFKLKVEENEGKLIEFDAFNVFFSEDCSYISGVTSTKTGLVDSQNIYLNFNRNDEFYKHSITVQNVEYQGYINEDIEYRIQDFYCSDNETIIKGVRYNDGRIYKMYEADEIKNDSFLSGITEISEKENPIVIIGNDYMTIDSDDNFHYDKIYDVYEVKTSDEAETIYSAITIPRKNYVIDGKISIGGISYDVDPMISGDTELTVYNGYFDSGTTFTIHMLASGDRKKYTNFFIEKEDDYKISIDSITCTKYVKYINYRRLTLTNENNEGELSSGFTEEVIYFKDAPIPNYDDIIEIEVDGETYSANTTDPTIIIGDKCCCAEYVIYSSWINTYDFTDRINIYSHNDDIDYTTGGDIIVKSISPTNYLRKELETCYYINVNGNLYYSLLYDDIYKFTIFGEDYTASTTSSSITINEVEYEIFGKDYIMFNNHRYFVSDSGDTVDFITITNSANTYITSYEEEYEISKLAYADEEEDPDGYIGYYIYDDSAVLVYVSYNEELSGITINRYTPESSSITSNEDVVVNGERKRYVYVNGNKYFVNVADRRTSIEKEEDSEIDYDYDYFYYVDIKEEEIYHLEIEEVIGSSCLRCKLINEYDNTSLLNNLVNSTNDYSFYYENRLFPINVVRDQTLLILYPPSAHLNLDEEFIGTLVEYYTNNSFFTLPLILSNDSANNMLQDKIVKRDFVDAEVNKAINRIVDMEKDIYYPAFSGDDGTHLVDELCFKLHFRTRDLDSWKVIEDQITYYDEETYSAATSASNASNAAVATNCNWNIIDYYYDDYNDIGAEISPTLSGNNVTYEWVDYDGSDESETNYGVNDDRRVKKVYHDDYTDDGHNIYHSPTCSDNEYYAKNITKFSQPADLLYFLNFTNNDVYNKKEKISKSFIRLLFYDSMNANEQSLLATSTIFLDVDKLYKCYIDGSEPNTYDDYGFIDINSGIYTEYCGVSKEPFYLGGDGIWTYNEDLRMSATFTVKNMMEELKSSEGFYLSLFKEYSSNLHERNIYLKVQFNHAGTGKVVNLLVPTKRIYNDDGSFDIDLLDITDEEDRETFKKGYPIDELVEAMYINLKVKYDDTLHKYVYYLPQMLYNVDDDGRCVFNLYETKIKDESAVTK